MALILLACSGRTAFSADARWVQLMRTMEAFSAWAAVHARARRMVNRLTAVTAQVDLLVEQEPPSTMGGAPTLLESMRAELAATTRGAKTLAETIALELPSPGESNLAEVLRDAMAPMEPYLRRRETKIALARNLTLVRIGVEPDLLRTALATALDVLFRAALPSEVADITHEPLPSLDILRMNLTTCTPPPERSLVERDLASLRTWLEERSGTVEVLRTSEQLAIVLSFPRMRSEP